MVLVQLWSPHQVLQPIAQIDPPFQGFRDAGYSNADFEITIQDIVYAMWRAKERGMVDLTTFNLEEYEQYERVDQGDFNVISKDFIAFASPQSRKGLNEPFKKVLNFFLANDVQLVVRLNSHLYDAAEFTRRGIQHIDMIFDDGTCPTLEYVQKFIGAAETVIHNGGKIAVHCKAGLGRTGCLIGAHLIYTHGFTANECIAYMRMIRPGMVVGPQQHWLYLHQNAFRDWRHTMCLDNRPDAFIGGLFPLTSYDEFKARMKSERKKQQRLQTAPNSSFVADSSFNTPVRRRKISGALTAKIQTAVPQELPGQPRKYRENRDEYPTHVNNSDEENDMVDVRSQNQTFADTEVDDEINNSDGVVLYNKDTSSPRREASSDWLPKTTTTPTTRTVSTTLSSSPSAPGSKTPKTRSVSRVGATPKPRIPSGGVRKVSGGKKIAWWRAVNESVDYIDFILVPRRRLPQPGSPGRLRIWTLLYHSQ